MLILRDVTIFCGCSYTSGAGLELEKNDPNLWVNILHQSVPQLKNTTLLNAGLSGSTNENIFLSALDNIVNHQQCKNLFVSFTSIKRMHVNPSVETYDTWVYLERSNIADVKINPNITIVGSYIENIRDRFFDLTHVHYDLLKILKYTRLLSQAAKQIGINIFFINSILYIDQHYFNQVLDPDRLPSDTTLLTQKLLNAETRADEEYFQVYDKIHQDYKNSGGLLYDWLNLDQGFRTNFYLDKGNDQLHPGIKSNQAFAKFLIEKIKNKQQ